MERDVLKRSVAPETPENRPRRPLVTSTAARFGT